MNTYLENIQKNQQFIGQHLPWLLDIQKSSLEQFIATGFPNRHQENWKYTDLTFLSHLNFQPLPFNHFENFSHILHPSHDQYEHQMVFIDGQFSAQLSKINALDAKITFTSIKDILLKDMTTLASYFKQSLHLSAGLASLNAAFLTDGFFLHILKNVEIKSPIHLLFLSTAQSGNTMTHPRNIVILEDGAKATLFEEHAVLNDTQTEQPVFKNMVSSFFVGHQATLNHWKLQAESRHTIHIAQTHILQAKDSQVNVQTVSLGAKMARDDLNVYLNDLGASCQLQGLYVLADRQHVDHHTRIDHHAMHTHSQENYKGILKDHAKGVFNGKVMVHPNAQKIKSSQINKNLLLSETAEMNTKPELEIYADDVQCTHGATVGQIDADILFYLRARGLDLKEATKLLVHAFYHEVLNNISTKDIHDYLQILVAKKLEDHS